ncbi:MAG: glycosyltransferase family 1 protein [Bacteroidales bacterium]|nr:glycosyltransferase family 1 protein [Bacteroidales bacterium]HOY37834.1 glycosyltransferase [Bacteroidales bacterium]
MKRVYHRGFLILSKLLLWVGYVCLPFIKLKKINSSNYAVLPYTPENWPGGKDRMAAWKPYFAEISAAYSIFWAWQEDEMQIILEYGGSENVVPAYKVYTKILIRRFRLLFSLRNYKSVWVQRAFVPSFPFRNAYFERLASFIHPYIVYDFYDADYIHNKNLVDQTARLAFRVSVASKHLYNYFSNLNPATFFLRYAIIADHFIEKPTNNDAQTIHIGWMGSPDNAKQLIEISAALSKLEEEFEHIVFSFTCRKLPKLPFARLERHSWGDEGFSYNTWLAGLDIGIVPYMHPTETVKAKIAMKSLEFMGNAVPMVVSPYMHSDMLVHGRDVYIASTTDDWYEMLKALIISKEKRTAMGKAAKLIFDTYHSFRNNFEQLKQILEP